MLAGLNVRQLKETTFKKMNDVEIIVLRWMSGNILIDQINNESMRVS